MNRLKELRRGRRCKQGALCSTLGISVKTMYNYEQGIVDIPSGVLVKLAEIYDVSVDYLLGIKKYTTFTVTDAHGEVVAVVSNSEIIEHTGYSVILSED